MDYFKTFKSDISNAIYSLDMVRLNIDLGNHITDFNSFIQRISDYDLRYDVAYYPSYKAFKYRHVWSLKDTSTDYSWSIGLDLGGKSEDKSKGFIEFNPNKCENSPLFQEFWQQFSLMCPSRELVRYDLAIDLPFRRGQCRLLKQNKKVYQLISSDDGFTEYLGVRSHNGFIKLYDKTIESDLDYDLTRLEITLDKDGDFTGVFPKVLIFDPQYSLDLDMSNLKPNDKVLISLLRSVEEPMFFFRQLSYEKRKKIEPYLADKVLQSDINCWYSVRSLATSYTRL